MSGNYPFLSARKRGGSGGSGAPAFAAPIVYHRSPAKAGAQLVGLTYWAPAFAGEQRLSA